MVDYCISLNFIQNRSLVETFDKWVILAFFLTLLFTIVIVVCVVKYITYNLQQDRDREQMILERKNKPRIDEISEESDDEFVWSDSEENDQLPDLKSEAIDNETISLYSNLQTNYVGELLNSGSSEDENEIDEVTNNSGWLPIMVVNDVNIELQSPYQILTSIYTNYSSEEHYLTFSMLTFYISSISKIVSFRKSAFSQTVDFAIEVLCSLHILPESEALSLKTRYEQQIDKLHNGNDQDNKSIHSIIHHGEALLSISQNCIEELENCTGKNDIGTHMKPCLQSEPLDMLKVYILSLPNLHNMCVTNAKSVVNGIKSCEKLLFNVKARYCCLRNIVISETSNAMIAEVLSEFEVNISKVFHDFQRQFIDALHNVRHLYLVSINEEQQTILKLEEDLGEVKLNVINSDSSKSFEEKLQAFHEMTTAFIASLFEDSNRQSVLLLQQKEEIIKNVFSAIQKRTFSKMNEIEETLLISLKDRCNVSDKTMLGIVEEMQESLTTSVQTYQQFVNDCQTSFLKTLNQSSKLVYHLLEHIIKTVSSKFKKHLAANNATVKSWPSVKVLNSVDDILSHIHGKLSTTAFDIVHTLMYKLFSDMLTNQTFGTFTISKVDMNNLHNDILNTKQMPDVHSSTFLHRQTEEQLSDLQQFEAFLSGRMKEYHEIIVNAFDEVSLNIQKEIKEKLIESLEVIFFENIQIYSCIKEQISKSGANKKTSKTYLSRKRSSFREKTKHTELLELYQGLLDVKEHKYLEKCKQDALLLHRNDTVKSGTNFTVKYLNKQLDILVPQTKSTKINALFEFDQYHMRTMFLKKLKELDEVDKGDITEDQHQGRSSVLRKPTKTSTLQKKSNQQGEKLGSKKMSFLPKKRKSRRIADSNV